MRFSIAWRFADAARKLRRFGLWRINFFWQMLGDRGRISGLSAEFLVDALFDYLYINCGQPAQTV